MKHVKLFEQFLNEERTMAEINFEYEKNLKFDTAQRQQRLKFWKSAKTKTKNFFEEGTEVTNPREYSVKDFEDIAKLFNSKGELKGGDFKVVKNGPSLKFSDFLTKEARVREIVFNYDAGRWTGGFEGGGYSNQAVNMNLEEFVMACTSSGWRDNSSIEDLLRRHGARSKF